MSHISYSNDGSLIHFHTLFSALLSPLSTQKLEYLTLSTFNFKLFILFNFFSTVIFLMTKNMEHNQNWAWRTETLASTPPYKSIMRLTIYNVQHSDFGVYKCVGELCLRLPFSRLESSCRCCICMALIQREEIHCSSTFFYHFHYIILSNGEHGGRIFNRFKHNFPLSTLAAKNPRDETESSIRLYGKCVYVIWAKKVKKNA